MNQLILYELPPSVNHYYVNRIKRYRGKDGKMKSQRMRVLTDDAQRWYNNAVLITNLWRVANQWEQATGKVIVRLWFYFKDGRHIDTHNGLKGILDAFEDAEIYTNDRNALPQIMDFEIDRDNPRLVVEFERMNDSCGNSQ